jgi:hypothetical protein
MKKLLIGVLIVCLGLSVLTNIKNVNQLGSWDGNNDAPSVRSFGLANDATEITPSVRSFGLANDATAEKRNLHDNFPLQCGQSPAWLYPSIDPLVNLYMSDREAAKKHKYRFNEGGHAGGLANISELSQTQVCLYDTLHRWRALAKKHNIKDWAAHGGTLIGATCFGAMDPWDDDLDLTMHNCSALDNLFMNGGNVSKAYPDLPKDRYSMHNSAATWDARLVEDDLLLIKGGICCPWYKLFHVQHAFRMKKGGQIGGIDIECLERGSAREKAPKRTSGWVRHMQEGGKLDQVMFGPTEIQMVPREIANSYISLRYGKHSPCRYPYSNGQAPESILSTKDAATQGQDLYAQDIDKARIDFALSTWYVPKKERNAWRKQAGNGKQAALTNMIPNLDEIEIDNTISAGCNWGANATLKLIGWNAERGKYWDIFSNLVNELDALRHPYVILLNEMDIGMARSFNVHTARRLALELKMNYAFGVEFIELTRGTEQEQQATHGLRDALSIHGNAILSKCYIGDTALLRDPLPRGYFDTKPVRGINANGFEIRLGGRMGIFARLFQEPPPEGILKHYDGGEPILHALPPHFVVGNVHKLSETDKTRSWLWKYYGFGEPPQNSTKYEGKGIDQKQQLGVIIQGDFGPQFCALGGLTKMNNYRKHKTFPVRCTQPKVDFGVLSGDYFCSNMQAVRDVQVSAPCDFSNNSAVELSDHAIVSVIVKANSDMK